MYSILHQKAWKILIELVLLVESAEVLLYNQEQVLIDINKGKQAMGALKTIYQMETDKVCRNLLINDIGQIIDGKVVKLNYPRGLLLLIKED